MLYLFFSEVCISILWTIPLSISQRALLAGFEKYFVLMLIFCHICSFYTDRVGRKEIRQDTAPRNQRETVDDCDIHCSISVPLVFPTRAFSNVILPNPFPNYSALFCYIPTFELLNVCTVLPNANSINGYIMVTANPMRAIYRWSCKGYVLAYPILGNNDLIFAMLHADNNYRGWVGTLRVYLFLSRALLSRMPINMFFPKKY